MTGKDLFHEIGNINEKYITEAEETKKSIIHNVAFRRGLGTVACLVLCIGIFAITRIGEKSASAPAADTAHNSATYMESEGVQNVGAESGVKESTPYDSDVNDFLNDLTGNKKEEFMTEAADSCPQHSVQEDMMAAEPDISEQEDIAYNNRELVSKLQSYSNVYEELLETEAFVVVHGKAVRGRNVWQKFLEDAQAEIPSEVDLVEFTEEGDAIITGLVYDGEIYHVVMDCTRDAWGKTEILEYEYKYLYTDTQDGCTEVVLSDLELEGEEIREAILTDSLDVHYLVQYKEE
ncbi:MAG: DUF4362 domain-containing protein [Lachnospiraceae bacterium]|nr:DUF4362 domain-containing protein [Lachnospiraceae bacterium]